MTHVRAASLVAIALLSVSAARADEAKPAAAAAAPAAADRAHIDAAVAFLKALTHTSRKGDQAAQAWDALKAVAGEKVSVTVAGAHHDLDIAAKTGDAKLVTFQKIGTLREGKEIKGATVEMLDFKIGTDEHKGKGKLLMSQADGKWTVQAIEAE